MAVPAQPGGRGVCKVAPAMKHFAALALCLVTIALALAACSQANDAPVAEAAQPFGGSAETAIPTTASGELGNPCDGDSSCGANLRCLADDSSPTGRRCCHGYVDPDTEDLGCW
jgi:hypothetical protein